MATDDYYGSNGTISHLNVDIIDICLTESAIAHISDCKLLQSSSSRYYPSGQVLFSEISSCVRYFKHLDDSKNFRLKDT